MEAPVASDLDASPRQSFWNTVRTAIANGDRETLTSALKDASLKTIMVVLHLHIARTEHWGTSLIVAASAGLTDVVQLLLDKHGVNINQRKDVTALWAAVHAGHLDTVKLLVRKGADVNRGDVQNETPLCVACRKGRIDMVKYFVLHGADADLAAVRGSTPLSAACAAGHKEIVEYLLEKVVNFDCKPFAFTWDVLREAVCSGDVEILLLVTYAAKELDGADIWNSVYGLVLRSSTMLTCLTLYPDVPRRNKIDCLELLAALVAPTGINRAYALLHRAMRERYKDPSDVISKRHALPVSLFGKMVESQTLEDLEKRRHQPALIHIESLVNRLQICGRHAQDYVALIDSVFYILSYVSHTDLFSFWHQIIAVSSPERQMNVCMTVVLQGIRKMAIEVDSLYLAVEQILAIAVGSLEYSVLATKALVQEPTLSILLKYIAVAHGLPKNPDERERLHRLVYRVLRLPHDKKVDALQLTLRPVSSILDIVPPGDRAAFFQMLVECGADVDCGDDCGETPLHIVATCSDLHVDNTTQCAMLKTLLKAGAHVDLRNAQGLTPLDCAASEKVKDILRKHYPLSLKCLAATVVVRHKVSFQNRVAAELENFLHDHRCRGIVRTKFHVVCFSGS